MICCLHPIIKILFFKNFFHLLKLHFVFILEFYIQRWWFKVFICHVKLFTHSVKYFLLNNLQYFRRTFNVLLVYESRGRFKQALCMTFLYIWNTWLWMRLVFSYQVSFCLNHVSVLLGCLRRLNSWIFSNYLTWFENQLSCFLWTNNTLFWCPSSHYQVRKLCLFSFWAASLVAP